MHDLSRSAVSASLSAVSASLSLGAMAESTTVAALRNAERKRSSSGSVPRACSPPSIDWILKARRKRRMDQRRCKDGGA
eukprot:6195134-Pleurochrysis_carterae.AAC.3